MELRGKMIPKEIIESIREQVNIVDVVSEYVELRKHGSSYMAPCPFIGHNDTKASFSVSESKQIYKCFGCGKRGNVFTFLMDYEGRSFVEVVRELGQRVGIEVKAFKVSEMTESLYELNKKAVNVYLENMSSENREGLRADRLLVRQTQEDFEIGFCTGSFAQIAEEIFDRRVVREVGLFYDDRNMVTREIFQGRYIFPIRSMAGNVVGFAGYGLGMDPKYRNVAETRVYSKARNLFGLWQARAAIKDMGFVIVVEGYFDVMTLYQNGYKNVVGICGTAFGEQQAKLLKRVTDNVVLFFDDDKAGWAARELAFPYLYDVGMENIFTVGATRLDPDEFVRKYPDRLSKIVEEAEDCIVYLMDVVDTVEERIEILQGVVEKLVVPDRRTSFVNRYAEMVGVPVSSIYNPRVLRASSRIKKRIDLDSELLLLAALWIDRDGLVDEFVKEYVFQVEVYQAVKQVIGKADKEADLYDLVVEPEEREVVNNMLIVAQSGIGVETVISRIKVEGLQSEIDGVLLRIKSAEKDRDIEGLMKAKFDLDNLVIQRETIGGR